MSGTIAEDRCDWSLAWTEDHSRSYGLKEGQVQSYMDKPEPGQESGRLQSVPDELLLKAPFNSIGSFMDTLARYRLVQCAG